MREITRHLESLATLSLARAVVSTSRSVPMTKAKRKANGPLLDGSPSPDLSTVIRSLQEAVETLTGEVKRLHSRLNESEAKNRLLEDELRLLKAGQPESSATGVGPQQVPFGHPPSSIFAGKIVSEFASRNSEIAVLSMTCDTLLHSTHVVAKSRHAVVERLYDTRKSDDVTNERLLIDSICDIGNVQKPVHIWRHATKSQSTNRPLKLEFNSRSERDEFIRIFGSSIRSVSWRDKFPGRKPIARRDMTPPELRLLYLLRQEAHRMNQDAGEVAYQVIDLQLVKLKKPYPLPSTSPRRVRFSNE